MARLTDPDLLAKYHQVLRGWAIEGNIELVGRAQRGLRDTLDGVAGREFKEALYRHVFDENGEIDQVREQREQWRALWEWHYDLRPTIRGLRVYVETRLFPEAFGSRQEPMIYVVQIKPA
ncbi:MAG: hypothetical protein JNM56_06385 [Planctomycetia bacterium]|nr:hypothetical protein [Planctomycetia bacterium]